MVRLLSLAVVAGAIAALSYVAVLVDGAVEMQAVAANRSSTVPALLVFGDSLVDPGNNDALQTLARSNFPPYGRSFLGHKPTGRFSDGKIATDYLASTLGVKELLPAYLDPDLKPEELLTGVSFGSAGTGFDTLTAQTYSVLSMWEQLEMFREYKKRLKAIAGGEEKAAHLISNSLYVVCAANNDIVVTYYGISSPQRRMQYDFPSYASLLVDTASRFIQELYHEGARKVWVLGVPPLGCLPSQRTVGGGKSRECVAPFNEAAKLYNFKLRRELDAIGKRLAGSKLVYIDFYTAANEVIQNPKRFGFEQADTGCCGTGMVEYAILCNQFSHTCANASKYVFFDSFHPTQRTYEVVVPGLAHKYLHSLG